MDREDETDWQEIRAQQDAIDEEHAAELVDQERTGVTFSLDELESVALRAEQDPDVWASIVLPPGFDRDDREFVATFHPQLVLALIKRARG